MPLDTLGLPGDTLDLAPVTSGVLAGPDPSHPLCLYTVDDYPDRVRLPFNPLRKHIRDYRGSLYSRACQYLQSTFENREHNPSAEMYDALEDAIRVMAEMANGTAKPMKYLSGLDCGVGKSSAVQSFLAALTRCSRDYPDTGAIICLSRLEEIRSFASECSNLGVIDYVVLAADRATYYDAKGEKRFYNDLGRGKDERHLARVLLTTQAQIERRCSLDAPFDTVTELYYLGQPRSVRVWDEALTPGAAVTVGALSIGALLKPLNRSYPDLVKALRHLQRRIEDLEPGTVIDVPDLAKIHGVTERDAQRVLRDREDATVTAVWRLFGKTAVVRKAFNDDVALTYHNWLPPDIDPILVLDASSRIGLRRTYPLWEEHGAEIEWLKTADKDFSPLEIFVWDRGGGKKSFKDNSDEIVQGIVETIVAKPAESNKWAIVVHKPDSINDIDVAAEIRKGLSRLGYPHDEIVRTLRKRDEDGNERVIHRVEFITWGAHTASNDYRDANNVILAGLLNPPTEHVEALFRSIAGVQPGDGEVSQDMLDDFAIGETLNNLVQAANRGAIRFCDGDKCPPSSLYIVVPNRSGIPAVLTDIVFPGAALKSWFKKTGRRVDEAIAFMLEWFERHPEGELPILTIRKGVGVTNAANFNRAIRRHTEFTQARAEHGIIDTGGLLVKTANLF
jgi:hypothetical protein